MNKTFAVALRPSDSIIENINKFKESKAFEI